MAIFHNGRKVASTVAAIPAGFFAGGARAFVIGGYNNAPFYYTGAAGDQLYAVTALSDGAIFSIFEGSRAAFGR